MDTSWKSHLDVVRGIIYPLVCNTIEARRAQVRENQNVKTVEYRKYDLVYISRTSMLNPLNKGKLTEFNKGPCIILAGQPYDNNPNVYKYTVKYLITGQVYRDIHYRRILK
eukprot:Nk52_evm1s1968 gene=Nk52_evmTU1s1968